MYPRLNEIPGAGPYKAEPIGPYGWWIVVNSVGFNCAVLGPGRTLGTETECKEFAKRLN